MTTTKPRDPPAFPSPLDTSDGGMSLRDYFAGQIAAGMAAFSGTAGAGYGPYEIAGRSYQIADAMLAEWEKRYAE
jgi:hypothetical protein